MTEPRETPQVEDSGPSGVVHLDGTPANATLRRYWEFEDGCIWGTFGDLCDSEGPVRVKCRHGYEIRPGFVERAGR